MWCDLKQKEKMEVWNRVAHRPWMVGGSSSPELRQLHRPAAESSPFRLKRARRQQPFVHTTEEIVEGRPETASSLCPHCGAFKRFRWAFEQENRGRGRKLEPSRRRHGSVFMQGHNGGQ